ncbi:MAG: hypothetical protein ACD_10C00025G0002 [uncultured bacterium]|nr:MAG: hypothetical protein ACD_10C00025G0002 [uncultured bacterium]
MTAFKRREVEQFINQVKQARGALFDALKILSQLRLVDRIGSLKAELGEAQNCVHRGAQLVRHIGEKIGFCLIGGKYPF